MTTIKSYTDFSQSEKLAEILPLESADMKKERKDYLKHLGKIEILMVIHLIMVMTITQNQYVK